MRLFKPFILVLVLLLIYFVAYAGVKIIPFGVKAPAAAGGECDGKILCFGGESGNTDLGSTGGNWTPSTECSVMDATALGALNGSPSPFSGSYSIYCTQSTDAGNETFQSPNVTYSAGVPVYIYSDAWRDGVSGFPWELRGYDSGNNVVLLARFSASTMRIYQGTVYNETYPATSADTHYYIWLSYTPCTTCPGTPNGVATLSWGTSGTYSSATTYTESAGDATTDIQYLVVLSGYNASAHYNLFDRIYLQTSAIGDVAD